MVEFVRSIFSGVVELWMFIGFAIYYSSLPGKVLFICLGIALAALHVPPIVYFLVWVNFNDSIK